MKIIVTGGAGFIGSAVVRKAISKGHQVVNVDCLTYAACLDNLSSVGGSPLYCFEQIDIRDRVAVGKVLDLHAPDAVMHLAAESHVDRSIDDPSAFIETNILGTFNLLESARKFWNQVDKPQHFRFLHISTDEVFGSLGKSGKFSEFSPYDPRSPYSASKASSDHLVRAWGKTYNLPVLVSNCSNNYGPYQFPEKLVPVVIICALSGKKIPIYGNGENVRDWLHVEDHADALLAILSNGQVGRSYNIGAEGELSNIDLVHLICKILDEKAPSKQSYTRQISHVDDRPGHDTRYAIDATRIQEELKWHPSIKLQEGLEATVDWYLENRDWWRSFQNRDGVGSRLGRSGLV